MIKRKYNNKTDIWSTGIIMYELAEKMHPFPLSANETYESFFLKIVKSKI